MKFIERENEMIRIIKKLLGIKFIVVGGYAVSARAKHRFSVDCDIIISKKDAKKINDILIQEGYNKLIDKKGFDAEYGGKFIRYVKKIEGLPVSVDLLVGSIVSRTTNASWSFEYVLKNSNKAIIAGIKDSVECFVPIKELLIAFKIHSGRKTDLRDIIMLRDADWNIIKNNIKRGDLKLLKKQINNMLKDLDDKTLTNSLKGVFRLSYNVEKMVGSTKKDLKKLLKSIYNK